jgi:large subunit ribosomal protein L23
MKHVHQVVRRPLLTEKTTRLRDANGIYCFEADVRANKIEIAEAVERLYGVQVAEVRTARVRGKRTRLGRFEGRARAWKKAWVRLAPGSKQIDFFEAS